MEDYPFQRAKEELTQLRKTFLFPFFCSENLDSRRAKQEEFDVRECQGCCERAQVDQQAHLLRGNNEEAP